MIQPISATNPSFKGTLKMDKLQIASEIQDAINHKEYSPEETGKALINGINNLSKTIKELPNNSKYDLKFYHFTIPLCHDPRLKDAEGETFCRVDVINEDTNEKFCASAHLYEGLEEISCPINKGIQALFKEITDKIKKNAQDQNKKAKNSKEVMKIFDRLT